MKFKDVIGNKELKQRLLRTTNEGRISHAQMLHGPVGCGNLPLTLAYIQYLQCEKPGNYDSCGECPSCKKMQNLIHPDLHLVFPIILSQKEKIKTAEDLYDKWRELIQNNPYASLEDWHNSLESENKQGIISVRESERLIEKLSLKPYEGKYKFALIWMPEKLRTEAANKLLKIIEEPPEDTLFILVTHAPENVLPTIRSRTQLLQVPRIHEEDIANYLRLKKNLNDKDARIISELSDGNLNEAIQQSRNSDLTDQNTHFNFFVEWMRLVFTNNTIGTIEWVSKISTLNREEQKQFLRYSLHILRQALAGNFGAKELVKVTENEADFLKKFAPYLNANNGIQMAEEIEKAIFHIERNAESKTLFLDLSFILSSLISKKSELVYS
ncbi:MAG: ATP-binding protein [Flavobacteriales bacterium]